MSVCDVSKCGKCMCRRENDSQQTESIVQKECCSTTKKSSHFTKFVSFSHLIFVRLVSSSLNEAKGRANERPKTKEERQRERQRESVISIRSSISVGRGKKRATSHFSFKTNICISNGRQYKHTRTHTPAAEEEEEEKKSSNKTSRKI